MTVPEKLRSAVEWLLNIKSKAKEKRYKYEKELKKTKKTFIEEYKEYECSKNMSSKDFKWITNLGNGGYSSVYLGKQVRTGKFWAVKVMLKKGFKSPKDEEHLRNEMTLQKAAKHPFIVGFDGFFMGEHHYYLLLEYCGGGNLTSILTKQMKLTEDQARFYAANVFLALEYLHSVDIIYRDLKPDNMLLDESGYVKLCDLGLSKRSPNRTTTFCGTVEYYAPEVYTEGDKGTKMGYGKEVDWWTFGIFLHEMTTGNVPFETDRCPIKYQEKVKAGPSFSPLDELTPELNDLLGHLVTNADSRYGGPNFNYKLVQHHDWFHDVDWDDVFEKKVRAPFNDWMSAELREAEERIKRFSRRTAKDYDDE